MHNHLTSGELEAVFHRALDIASSPETLAKLNNALINKALKTAQRRIGLVKPGSELHDVAIRTQHKLRLEACRRTGNMGVQHARAVFPNY